VERAHKNITNTFTKLAKSRSMFKFGRRRASGAALKKKVTAVHHIPRAVAILIGRKRTRHKESHSHARAKQAHSYISVCVYELVQVSNIYQDEELLCWLAF
jgi:hypothetical protein